MRREIVVSDDVLSKVPIPNDPDTCQAGSGGNVDRQFPRPNFMHKCLVGYLTGWQRIDGHQLTRNCPGAILPILPMGLHVVPRQPSAQLHINRPQWISRFGGTRSEWHTCTCVGIFQQWSTDYPSCELLLGIDSLVETWFSKQTFLFRSGVNSATVALGIILQRTLESNVSSYFVLPDLTFDCKL